MEHGGVNSKTPRGEEAVVSGVGDSAIRIHFDVSDNKPCDGLSYESPREIEIGFRYLSFMGPNTNFTGKATNQTQSANTG